MQINLFTCSAERNRVDKSNFITNRFAIDGNLRNESSIIDPVILIEKTNPAASYYNYMYIEEFKRWYFINDIVSVRNKLWEIHAHVDVLYTWRAAIQTMECVIDKTESYDDSNVYYDDGSFVLDSRNNVEIKQFPNGLSQNGEYILICAGGM